MRRLVILAAVLGCLLLGVSAYEVPDDFSEGTLEEYVEEFMQAYSLDETNFSISYYNTVTGESYAYNDTWFSIAASTYKLPLNMVFYEMQFSGEITGDTCITWTGQTLDYIHEQSIVNSNNELSEALMYYWGSHTAYKEQLRRYFTMTDEEIDPLYWQANWFCTRMMMDCLKYLYENQDSFTELIGYMKQAMPGQYFKRGVTDYEVAHKYGAVQVYNNDVGIIYTPQPYLLAVYSKGGTLGSDGICAEASRLMTAYNLWTTEQTAQEELPEEEPTKELKELPVETVTEVREELPEEAQEETLEETVQTLPEQEQTQMPEASETVEAEPEMSKVTGGVLWIVLPAVAVLGAGGVIWKKRKK